MAAKTLMVLGTMSSAGKSLLVTALCRIYARRGLRVAPYKAQNMSNNAAVCADGSEIGRAQYTQALACGITPTAAMNPILLKPDSDSRSQIILMGRVHATLPAREYYQHRDELWQSVTAALDGLREAYDLVIMEGAGSPVEMNLKPTDMVNMAIAEYAGAPVLLAGDIDRGGIFAQLLGTLWLLEPAEQALVKGLLVNKFRGDPALFVDGVTMLEERGGVPVLGVIPYLDHRIPQEDAVAIEPQNAPRQAAGATDIAVVRLPRIANFDDFDPLLAEPGVTVRYVDTPEELGDPAAVILPGTKATIGDLNWLCSQGLDAAIRAYAARGGAVVGVCGGYQMLGQAIHDPDHVEARVDSVAGLGLLPVATTFRGEKATHQARAVIHGEAGWLAAVDGQVITGYEIHMGRTEGPEARRWLAVERRNGGAASVADGAQSADGRVWGCYIHGLFETASFRRAWLGSLGWRGEAAGEAPALEQALDDLADAVEAALDMDLLDAIIGL